jgi:hypothetical protein
MGVIGGAALPASASPFVLRSDSVSKHEQHTTFSYAGTRS